MLIFVEALPPAPPGINPCGVAITVVVPPAIIPTLPSVESSYG